MQINAYDGSHVDMRKVEEAAWKRAARGDVTTVHHHRAAEPCEGSVHERIGPEELKEREEANKKG
jgi:hypothetical protein